MPRILLAFLWKSKKIFVPLDGMLNAGLWLNAGWVNATYYSWYGFGTNHFNSFVLSALHVLATGIKNTAGKSIKTIELIWWIDWKPLTCSNEHDIHTHTHPFRKRVINVDSFKIIFSLLNRVSTFHVYMERVTRSIPSAFINWFSKQIPMPNAKTVLNWITCEYFVWSGKEQLNQLTVCLNCSQR